MSDMGGDQNHHSEPSPEGGEDLDLDLDLDTPEGEEELDLDMDLGENLRMKYEEGRREVHLK